MASIPFVRVDRCFGVTPSLNADLIMFRVFAEVFIAMFEFGINQMRRVEFHVEEKKELCLCFSEVLLDFKQISVLSIAVKIH